MVQLTRVPTFPLSAVHRGNFPALLRIALTHTSFANETDKTLKGSYSKNTGESTSWSSNLGLNYNLHASEHRTGHGVLGSLRYAF